MSEVVSLRGDAIRQPGQPDEYVVHELERALEMARSGEINGITIAYLHADDATSGRSAGLSSRAMIGMLHILIADLIDRSRQ
jgi:hypothetical protein